MLEADAERLVIPGVRKALESLRPGRKLGIVTSCLSRHFKIIHRKSGLLEYFDFIVGEGDYTRHKPHPEPYLVALERAKTEVQACLAVEDSERGVAAACAAGIRCAAIPRGISKAGDFSKAWKILPSIDSLPTFLEPRLPKP
jgi:HAD superfamily hydrolase (TIGR01509 family)